MNESAPAIRIGVSACLLGEAVRFDGGHKRDAYLVDTLGRYVEWVPVCPEVELGLGTPRETLRLVRMGGEIRMVMPKTGADHTAAMRAFAERRVRELEKENLCGYILKKSSPSCGKDRVRVFDLRGLPAKSGRGLFAEALLGHFPHLPVEEEGRLSDPRLRENFIERVFAYARLRTLFSGHWKLADLVAFQTVHKLLLMAHSPRAYQKLDRLVGNARSVPRAELRQRYEAEFMAAFREVATPRWHTNVLQYMTGYFIRRLDFDSRLELHTLIHDYRSGLVPLLVPLTLIRHYVRTYHVAYLQDQLYLDPDPKELVLRNHV